MKILFWQNIISKHQKDLLEQLNLEGHEITVAVESEISINRKNIGWDNVIYQGINVHSAESILRGNNTENFVSSFDFHVFSSISSYKYLYKAFKLCAKLKCRIAIYSESKDTRGLKGKLRILRSKVDYLKYNKNILKIFAIGIKGRDFYSMIGFPANKIVEYGYFVKPLPVSNFIENKITKYLFVGNINEAKGINELVTAFKSTKGTHTLDIYGDGPLKYLVLKNEDSTINYKGLIDNNLLLSIIHTYDYLILPSKYDGWGVVINEALLHGCNVITTSNVGSKSLIQHFPKSKIISVNDIRNELKDLIYKLKPLNKNDRIETIATADSLLNPREGALKLINELEETITNE